MTRTMLALLLFWCATGAQALDPMPFRDAAEEQRFQAITRELRCLVCQNQNIADSNAELAKDLRNEVFDMMRAGKTDAEINGGAAFGIHGDLIVRIAESCQPAQGGFTIVFPVQSDQREFVFTSKLHQHWMFLLTGHTPGTPDVQKVRFATQGLRPNDLAGLAQLRQLEAWGRLVDQWRRQGLGVEAKAQEQEHGQGQEQRDGNISHHAGAPWTASLACWRRVADARRRWSAAATNAPKVISKAPSQIQRMKGL